MERDRLTPAVVGAAATTVVTLPALIAAPVVVPFDPARRALYDLTGVWLWENPAHVLPFLGGVLGGLVAGYLTREDWYMSVVYGLYGVTIGVVLVFVADVVYRLAFALLRDAFFPSLVLIVGFRRLFFFLVPFGLLYLFEAALGSVLGYATRGVTAAVVTPEWTGTPERTLGAVRWGIAASAFLGLFLAVWWFLFVTENGF